MTNYPNSQDNNITLPGVSGVTQEDIAISALRDATFAIEEELGIKPSGIYSDVRARLDILESRINFSTSAIEPGILNDGYVRSPLFIFNVPSNVTLSISDGYGAPTENRLNGSLFMRADGYANNDFYIRRDGYWVPIQTEAFIAAGDLMGNHLSQTVIGLYGKPLNSTMATVGVTQDGYHLTWNNSIGKWEAQTGFIAASDLAADSAFFGRIGQRVIRFQNRTFSAAAPVGTTATNGSSIKWNNVQNQWEPQASPMIFIGSVNANDGYTTRTNISTNKALQSPMSATASKIGMINFGSSSAGGGTGTTDNYAAILSGDQNTASGQFSLIVNGISSVASGLYASILNGPTNIASNTSATVINGNSNTASGIQSIVLDGYTNVAAATNSFIGNGGLNTVQSGALFSSILNGISNTVTAGAGHAGIGWGTTNVITSAGLYAVILGGNGNTAGGLNTFLGTPAGGSVVADYGFIGTGLGNGTTTQRINASSPFSAIINGQGNIVNASSQYGFIGTGNVGSVTGNYATILNGTTCSVSGLHASILNGNTNNITGSSQYATIIDGYNQSISGAHSLIGDGYGHTIAGQFSSIINGNSNTINASFNTILNGTSNTIDSTSTNNAILFGSANNLTSSSSRVIVAGNSNSISGVINAYVLGQFNSVQGNSIKITGDSNIVGPGSNFNRIFGNSNSIDGSIQCSVFGANNNLINSTHDSLSFGSNNIIDGYGNNIILGMNNIGNSNFGLIFGQYGKTRLYGQQVQANARFTPGKIGEIQFSRLVLDGYSTVAGTQFFCQLQDTSLAAPINPSFVDGYSYDMQVRVLVVNTSPIGPNPVVPARFVIDVLAHQEGGTLVLDNVNQTLITPQSSGTPWTVTVGVTGSQLTISVDLEAGPPYVQPTNTPSNRRAIATIEMREMSRL